LIPPGIKNFVTIEGESRDGIRVVNRSAEPSDYVACFDPFVYNLPIQYSALRTMTLICNNGKGPFHADNPYWGEGTIELDDLTMITETAPGIAHYQVCVALGLSKGQRVIVSNSSGNGIMYAHNSPEKYDQGGCYFEIRNCTMPWTVVGDYLTYGQDVYKIIDCKLEYLLVHVGGIFGTRDYIRSSFTVEMQNNDIEYIKGSTDLPGFAQDDPWSAAWGGKWGVTDTSIHASVTCPLGTVAKGDLVSIHSAGEQQIKPWESGDLLYGVALDAFSPTTGPGIVQYAGTVSMTADAAAPIVQGDELELDIVGQAVKRTTGVLIGYARSELDTGTGDIRVKLVGIR
jgi:hypothetical protein